MSSESVITAKTARPCCATTAMVHKDGFSAIVCQLNIFANLTCVAWALPHRLPKNGALKAPEVETETGDRGKLLLRDQPEQLEKVLLQEHCSLLAAQNTSGDPSPQPNRNVATLHIRLGERNKVKPELKPTTYQGTWFNDEIVNMQFRLPPCPTPAAPKAPPAAKTSVTEDIRSGASTMTTELLAMNMSTFVGVNRENHIVERFPSCHDSRLPLQKQHSVLFSRSCVSRHEGCIMLSGCMFDLRPI